MAAAWRRCAARGICKMTNPQPEMERMNIVIVGHVDHGKSTIIGRLLADSNSLPEGKLAQIKAYCETNSRPFEYAFLIDALKDEQAQGITIDSARVFFKTTKRQYSNWMRRAISSFLKNMVTGASHAEAALLVIDASTRRQGNRSVMAICWLCWVSGRSPSW